MIKIDVSSNLGELKKALNSFIREEQDAVKRALNRTIEQAKVAASREIRDAGYNLKAKDIKKSIEIRRATRSNLEAVLICEGRPIPLLAYSAKRGPKGVSVTVKNGRKTVYGSFIATMASGHSGVFVRKPGMVQGKRGKMILNRKIMELFGPSIPSALANPIVEEKMMQMVRDVFPRRLRHELERIRLKK